MPRDPILTLSNLSFTRTALLSGQRLDGRSLTSYRDLSVAFPSSSNTPTNTPAPLPTSTTTTASVKLGTTHLLTTLTPSIGPPRPSQPLEGTLAIALNYSPLTSPAFSSSSSSSSAELTLLQQTLSSLFTSRSSNSGAVDLEALVLVPGALVWNLRIDVHVLRDDGGVLPCAALGVLGVLERCRVPAVEVKGGKVGRVWGLDEREGERVGVVRWVGVVEWSYLRVGAGEQEQEGGEVVAVSDASAGEVAVRDGSVIVGVTGSGEVVSVAKRGGLEVDASTLLRWVERSRDVAGWMGSVLRDALRAQEEEDRRVRGGREGGRSVDERL